MGIANQDFRLIKPSHQIINNSNPKLGLVGTINDNDGLVYSQVISLENKSLTLYESCEIQRFCFLNDQGKEHGKERWWYETGEKWIEIEYRDGVINGIHNVFYKNGNKKSQHNYRNGKEHGYYIKFYENGQKKSETPYQNGRDATLCKDIEFALYRSWYKDGKKKRYEAPNHHGVCFWLCWKMNLEKDVNYV